MLKIPEEESSPHAIRAIAGKRANATFLIIFSPFLKSDLTLEE